MAMAGAMAPLSAQKCILHSASTQQHCVLRQRLKECRQSVRRNLIVASGNGVQESSQSNDSATKMLRKEDDKEEKIANSNSNPKKPSPLEKEGTLNGDAAEGKDPSSAAVGRKSTVITSGKFADPRWTNGNWDLLQFTKDGKVDWDAVIDAEVMRRKWLEENPEASSNEEPVRFDSGIVPWWAWVRRFHLPQAELLNGRAAMLGFFAAYFIDSLTGIGLVDQTNSFFGKLFLFITVVGVMLVRKNEDIETIKTLIKESTFYDKQWQATWKDPEDKVNK